MKPLLKMYGFGLLLLLTLSVQPVFAQREFYNWCTTYGVRMDFNQKPLQLTTLPHHIFSEGTASISDHCGNLLFYTDGVNVWNKNFQVMDNGTNLTGGNPSTISSTQAALIIPKPGSDHLYYVFSNGALENNFLNGLSYSIVNLDENGGLGRVTSKNISLYSNKSEQMAAVKHANGTDYWLITWESTGNKFLAFLISASGVSSTPVASAPMKTTPSRGQLKINQQGTRIAAGSHGISDNKRYMTLIHFNNENGNFFNEIYVKNEIASGGSYDTNAGVEFSPDGNFLYVTETSVYGIGVSQYELNMRTVSDIEHSRVELCVGEDTNYIYLQMQLAPDGKIYIQRSEVPSLESTQISSIEFPNKKGRACKFRANGLSLNGEKNYFGFPNVIAGSYLTLTSLDISQFCFGEETIFQADSRYCLAKWDFGEPSSGVNNTSTEYNPTHLYATAGTFTVTFTNGVDTVRQPIRIVDTIKLDLGKDSIFCFGKKLKIGGHNDYASHLWNTDATSDSIIVKTSGIYWLEVSNECFSKRDSILITVIPTIKDFPSEIIVCDNESVELDAENSGADYIWSNGATTQTTTLYAPDNNYSVNISNQCFSKTYPFSVSFRKSDPKFTHTNLITPNHDDKNDQLLLHENVQLSEYHMEVYNRWGARVFATDNPEQTWNASSVNDGIYYYEVQFKNCKDEKIEEQGAVSVMR